MSLVPGSDRRNRGFSVNVRRHLYHARINRHLTLEQLGARTALSPSVLRHIDEGRFELLPSGLYARSYIRSVAAEVGLDPDAILHEVEHLLPGAPDPLPLLNEARGWTATERLARQLRALLHAPGMAAPLTRLRSRLESSPLTPRLNRCGAATVDALVLLAVDALLVLLVSWSSGVPIDTLLEGAGGALGAFCAVPIALYFLLFEGIAGSTPGRSVCRLIDRTPDHPLTLPDILRRAILH